ncbi:hypothetical protein [Streptomyces sp. NBC_01497]|uniref:hypothetical protein n=1 Tax=Streptomyces sp. NBC_01497 TaxID=2903885 RepID=UPI002E36C7B4|nr:hypothetical protein [Streptomyces sp. NBC_01497]
MTQSKARRVLTELTETMGKDGVLIVHKDEEMPGRAADLPQEALDADGPGDAWEDVVPGKALRWPKCECGSPKCPDYDALRTKVAERNRRSSRGGT